MSAAPASTFEDEISEPEYDTLAGAISSAKEKRQPKGEYDDSSTDDDEEGPDELEEESESESEVDEDFVE